MRGSGFGVRYQLGEFRVAETVASDVEHAERVGDERRRLISARPLPREEHPVTELVNCLACARDVQSHLPSCWLMWLGLSFVSVVVVAAAVAVVLEEEEGTGLAHSARV